MVLRRHGMLTLRNIYIELGEIFGFSYEKNQNGSYRVNTVIQYLVYPDLYLGQKYSENDICYFLAHPDFSYQAYPNIRNSFSELMNPKDTNRLPVLLFCDSIDIKQMYLYYDRLISDLKNQKYENYARLHAMLNTILNKDATFHARLKLTCSKEYEFLTWIILFAMFNDELANNKYEKHLQSLNEELADLSIAESGERHKLSTYLITRKEKLDQKKKFLYMLCTLQIFFSFLPFILPNIYNYNSIVASSAFSLTLLLLTIITQLLRLYQSKSEHAYSDLQTYHDYMSEIPDNDIEERLKNGEQGILIEPLRNTSRNNMGRNHFRSWLKIILYILLTGALIISLALNSFPILPALICIIICLLMYADRCYNDYTSRVLYDKKTLAPEEKPKHWRGLAKIYYSEYKKTGFDFNDEYYTMVVHVHSGTCYRHMFLMAYDRLEYNLYIYNISLAYFTGVFLLLEIFTVFLGDTMIRYLRLPNAATFNIIVSMYILGVGLYTLTTLLTSATSHEYLSKCAYASKHAEKNPEWAEKVFLNLHARGVIRNVDWMRGIFTYNIACFEKGKTIEEIFPESDHMLYYHRHITFRSVAKITVALSYITAMALFVWQLQLWYLALPITVASIVIYLYLYHIGLKKMHHQTILKELNQLSMQEAEAKDK